MQAEFSNVFLLLHGCTRLIEHPTEKSQEWWYSATPYHPSSSCPKGYMWFDYFFDQYILAGPLPCCSDYTNM